MLPSSIRGALLASVLLLAVSTTLTMAQETEDDGDAGGIPEGVNCADGLIIPIWKPFENLSGGDRFGRGLLYILLMVYLFIGVSIVSDRFMESIEMITAQEKEVTIKDPNTGKNQIIIVKVRKASGRPHSTLHNPLFSTGLERDRCQLDPDGVGFVCPRDHVVCH